jgi:hypothetical protein
MVPKIFLVGTIFKAIKVYVISFKGHLQINKSTGFSFLLIENEEKMLLDFNINENEIKKIKKLFQISKKILSENKNVSLNNKYCKNIKDINEKCHFDIICTIKLIKKP